MEIHGRVTYKHMYNITIVIQKKDSDYICVPHQYTRVKHVNQLKREIILTLD